MNNSHEEEVRGETLLETAEKEEQSETEEATEPEEKGQGKSEGPTDKEVKKWIKDNPFECDIKCCKEGKGGRRFRSKKMGGMNFHKYNSHGISGKKGKEGKQKTEPEGEDIMDEIVKRTEAADLRGKLTVAIKRITRLGKDDREALEPELAMVKSWKNQSLKKDITDEELNYIEGELTSNILPTIKDMEDDAKKEKKKKVEKRTVREDDDADDLFGYGDMREELKMMKIRAALDEAREDREAARRRRDREDERREEEHRARMQAMKSGGGSMVGGNSNNPMGLVYQREVIFKHDEDGNVMLGENGQPIAESMRETPMNPNAIVQSQGRRGDGGEGSTLKVLETAVKLVKGDGDKKDETLKELREERKEFMDKITNLTSASRDKDIYDNFNKIGGAISEINKKIDEDPMEQYITMQDRLKEHNISVDGSSSPEVRKIDLEIEREKTRRSTDIMMMNKTFGLVNTAIGKLSDGPIARNIAKKIGQDDVIAEEEELPEDAELEADIEQEVAPQPEEQPPAEEPTKRIRGKTKKRNR